MLETTLQLNKAISACARGESWRNALSLLRSPGAPKADVISYNSTANACVKGEQWQRALLLFGELEENAIESTVISYNIAMHAFEKANSWTDCMELLNEMNLCRIAWDVITCNTVVSSCGKCSKWQLAVAIALGAKHIDVVGINSAIDACSTASQWEEAVSLLSLIPDLAQRADVISFTSTISACEKGAQWQMVLGLLQQMEAERLQGNLMTTNTCISALSKGQEWRTALRFFQSLQTKEAPSTTSYGATIGAFSSTKFWQKAQQMMTSMTVKQVRKNVVIYNTCMGCADVAWIWAVQLLLDLEVCNLQRTSNSVGGALQALRMVPGHWQWALDLMPGLQLRNTIIYNSAITLCAEGVS